MKKFTMFVFVIALVIIAFETFRPQPPFTADTSYVTGALASFLGF